MSNKILTAVKTTFMALLAMLFVSAPALAGEADLVVPNIKQVHSEYFYYLVAGIIVSVLGLFWGWKAFCDVKKLDAHKCMIEIGNVIFETCKTYLVQQGKFLVVLEVLIALCIAFYFGYLQAMPLKNVLIILAMSVVGILGSYAVAWFGIRMNTLANARTAFASLKGNPLNIMGIPLKAGMSIGVLLVSVELIMMLVILLFIPGEIAGAC